MEVGLLDDLVEMCVYSRFFRIFLFSNIDFLRSFRYIFFFGGENLFYKVCCCMVESK